MDLFKIVEKEHGGFLANEKDAINDGQICYGPSPAEDSDLSVPAQPYYPQRYKLLEEKCETDQFVKHTISRYVSCELESEVVSTETEQRIGMSTRLMEAGG